MIFALARELKMDVREVESWPASLLAEWKEFLWKIVPEAEEKARRRAEGKRSSKSEARNTKRR